MLKNSNNNTQTLKLMYFFYSCLKITNIHLNTVVLSAILLIEEMTIFKRTINDTRNSLRQKLK